jgi:hypothetical protein
MRRLGFLALVVILAAPFAHRRIARHARHGETRASAGADAADASARGPSDAAVVQLPGLQPASNVIACTSDSECRATGRPGAHCFTAAMAAQYTQAFHDCAAGSSWRAQHEPGTCVFDECRPDDAPGGDTCGDGLRCGTLDMVPFPQRVCVPASCHGDYECRRHPGGRCASFFNAGRCLPGGWACSYATDPCIPRDPRHMCPVVPGMLNYCAPRNGRFSCVQEPAIVQTGEPPREP